MLKSITKPLIAFEFEVEQSNASRPSSIKGRNSCGKKVFTPDDRDRLMNKVDPDVVSAVATEILYFKDSYGSEKKNYLKRFLKPYLLIK